MSYVAKYDKRFEKALRRLPTDAQKRIVRALLKLCDDPRQGDVKKLAGADDPTWRLRVGDYRVIYEIFDRELLLIFIDVDHRKQVYRTR